MANCFLTPVFVGSVTDICISQIREFIFFRDLFGNFHDIFMQDIFYGQFIQEFHSYRDISAINRHFFYGEYSFIVNCSEYFSE